MREFCIVHISDLHISGPDSFESLEVLSHGIGAAIARMPGRRILVVSGDLVEEPTERALQAARTFVSQLVDRHGFTDRLIVAGNHDVKKLFGNLFYDRSGFDATFASSPSLFLRDLGLHLVGVDSTVASFAKGSVTKSQYDTFVSGVYNAESVPKDEAASVLRIVVLHHHPLPIASGEEFKVAGVRDEAFMYLQSPATFMEACLSLDTFLVLHGRRHVHGCIRYSLPVDDRPLEYYDNAWRDLFVLSAPSATGKDCNAGFNVIGCSSGLKEVTVHRYTRRLNKGAFERLDVNLPGQGIRLSAPKQVYRDVAFDVAAQLRALPPDPPEPRVLELASRLFQRRAFYTFVELNWQFLLYAAIRTRMTWEQEVHPRVRASSRVRSDSVRDMLLSLEGYTAKTLGVEPNELTAWTAKYIDDKDEFTKRLPRLYTTTHGEEGHRVEQGRLEILANLGRALAAMGVRTSDLGTQVTKSDYPD